ncbi:unnamed protein product, partial [Polarella glacialis]
GVLRILVLLCLGAASAGAQEAGSSENANVFRRLFAWFTGWALDADNSTAEAVDENAVDWLCPQSQPVLDQPADGLEVFLGERTCPFLAAFFSGSSPMAKAESLALTEQRLASSFPRLRYVRVDADELGIRALLQWDIVSLPTYVLFWPLAAPGTAGRPPWQTWHRWQGDLNPYDYHDVAKWISASSGLLPANSSSVGQFPGPLGLVKRGANSSSSHIRLGVCWTLIAMLAIPKILKRIA